MKYGSKGDKVKELQIALGFTGEDVDGVFANKTMKAWNKYFVNSVHEAAKIEELSSGVPAAITTAQAILESGYGGKVPTDINTGAYSYNLFGIKGKGPAGSVLIPTTEYIARKKVGILANFRAYNSFTESISGRTDFFIENRRYKPLFKSNDPVKWAVGLQKVTYATSETYAETLIKLMNQWNLK